MNAPILFFRQTLRPWAADILKAQATHEPIRAGDRWITVHPWGDSVPGVPILIREHPTKKGTYHVVGGAGGKLNYMELRGIKPQSDYKADASDRIAARKALERNRRKQDAEAGLTQPKSAKLAEIADRRNEARMGFVRAIGRMAGWDESEMTFPAEKYAGLSERVYKAVQKQWLTDRIKAAKKIVAVHRETVLADADLRDQIANKVPIVPDPRHPEDYVVADLDPVRPSDGGLGFDPKYAGRAADAAGGEDRFRAEIDDRRAERAKPGAADAAERRSERAEELQKELEQIARPTPPPTGVERADIDKIVAALKAEKMLRHAEYEARRQAADVAGAKSLEDVKAYNVWTSTIHEPDEKELGGDLADQLRTVRARQFLDKLGEVGDGQDPENALGRHVAVGASNILASATLTVAGAALVDRSTLDVLGMEGAARAVAERLRASLTPEEVDRVRGALEDWHLDRQDHDVDRALETAQQWLDVADGASPGDLQIHDGTDLALVQELNRRRVDALQQARKTLGTALGELEMTAALAFALREKGGRELQVSLGSGGWEQATTQLRALGLEPSDFTLASIGGDQIATVSPDGLRRLARPIDRASLERERTALDIIEGREDEPDWLPEGFARREDLNGSARPGTVESMAQPWNGAAGLESGIRDYVGGRVADGDNPRDIIADMLNNDFLAGVGDRDAFIGELGRLLPATREREAMVDGERKKVREHVPIESYRDTLEQWADDFVAKQHGAQRTAFSKQDVPADEISAEALHRALAKTPEGTAAFKPIGELQDRDKRALRAYFGTQIAKDSPDVAELRSRLSGLKASEPEKEVEDMFGETGTNPDWSRWRKNMDDARAELDEKSLTWDKYVTMMDGRGNAYQALQDMVRGRVSEDFHREYNTLRPEAPLRMGRRNIRNSLRHLGAVDPETRKKRLAELSSESAKMRQRIGGRFAEGAISEEREARREGAAGFKEAELGLFGDGARADQPLGADECHSLGHVAERRLAGLVDHIGRNFRADQPLKLWKASMTDRYINQQRAIKLIAKNQRIALAQGVGSGKSAIALGAFAHLAHEGKVKRGLFLVPSIVQAQMGAEALRYLEPGKFKWHCDPGASREQRLAAYRDPDHHFAVVTHQSFRDDMLYLAAQKEGANPAQIAVKLDAMNETERADYLRGIMSEHGIDYQYVMLDEAHNALNRAGKKNSALANVMDAVTARAPYYVSSTADPIKNDVSEAYDLLRKMNPGKYTDRDAFLRKYGVDSASSRDALRREMLQHLYPGRVDPGVAAKKSVEKVALTQSQQARVRAIDDAVGKLRVARMQGKTDMAAAKALAPHLFENAPADKHEGIAKDVAAYAGTLKQSAVRDAIDMDPKGAKMQRVVGYADERKGKPGVVFCHRLGAVDEIAKQLSARGHKVAVISGGMDSKQKDAVRRKFQPEDGSAPEADVLVCSDAAAVGANMQRGKWLLQYDTPDTAMVHAQRAGRIHRLGQTQDVEVADLVADHPVEAAARKRLAEKHDLREILTSPYENLDDSGLGKYLHRRAAEREDSDS